MSSTAPETASTQPGERPALPDINAQTYPFEIVQYLLDQAGYFNLYSVPNETGNAPISQSGSITGITISEQLRRFEIRMRGPSSSRGFLASNRTGGRVGQFDSRWVFIPDNFVAVPGREPPPTALDPSRAQRFVILNGKCTFEGGHDGFEGFGTGKTFPSLEGGRSKLLVAATCTLLRGFGRFHNLEGTYTYVGTLSPDSGFRGSLLIRVMDPEERLQTENPLPSIEASEDPEPGVTYLLFRGQKRDPNQHTAYSFGPDGQVNGLDVTQQLRTLDIDCAARGEQGIRSSREVGPVVGKMSSQIAFNLFNPGAPGTDVAPIPFKSYNVYTFLDDNGHSIGSFDADGSEGRTFNLKLVGAPGQQALRFGAFGPVLNGKGDFAGVEGLMTDNSVVGVAPHAIVTMYVVRVNDPSKKYRAASNLG
jgi:hypothetical protein